MTKTQPAKPVISQLLKIIRWPNSDSKTYGFFVQSTAPYNVEEGNDTTITGKFKNSDITDIPHIANILANGKDPEIIIQIHGYSTSEEVAIENYERTFEFIRHNKKNEKTSVFLGYRWPSESAPSTKKIWNALPIGLKWILAGGLSFLWYIMLANFGYMVGGLIGLILFNLLLAIIAIKILYEKLFSKLPKSSNKPFNFKTLFFTMVWLLSIYPLLPLETKLPKLIILTLFSFSLTLIPITLILLRVTAYFRDSYRATNYGAPDLVELIRNIDNEINNKIEIKLIHNNGKFKDFPDEIKKEIANVINIRKIEDEKTKNLPDQIKIKNEVELLNNNEKIKNLSDEIKKEIANEIIKKRRIKLSFIGHSMGCYVTTNAIRTLSDLFNTEAIKGNPSSYIGNYFTLSRLILVAPDIPVETIVQGRANFLASSLRRFDESYLFSNEGDVVLRILSTIANYFSFPTGDLWHGYRLGNITVEHPDNNNPYKPKYGIVDFNSKPYYRLDIRSTDGKNAKITLEQLSDKITNSPKVSNDDYVADFFTYFDCTDYEDIDDSNKPVTPVSLAAKKKALNLMDYINLVVQHLILGNIDTHGGYFNGKFTQELISKLALMGFNGLLNDYYEKSLEVFSDECNKKQIQGLISPKLYNSLQKN